MYFKGYAGQTRQFLEAATSRDVWHGPGSEIIAVLSPINNLVIKLIVPTEWNMWSAIEELVPYTALKFW